MNYNEKYEVRMCNTDHPCWIVLHTFYTEKDAVKALDMVSPDVPGTWRVVRVTEVTVASVSKA